MDTVMPGISKHDKKALLCTVLFASTSISSLCVTGGASAADLDAVMARLEKLETDNKKMASEIAVLKEKNLQLENNKKTNSRVLAASAQAKTVSSAPRKTELSRQIGSDQEKAPFVNASRTSDRAQSNWNGVYLGFNAGYAEGQANYNGNTAGPVQSYPCAGFSMCSNNLNYSYPTFYYFSGENNLSGPVAGGQIGYNYQYSNHLIIGAETDFNYADINNRYANTGARQSTEVSKSQVYAYGNNDRTGINWIGTARLRLGYDLGKFLPYITGGFSYASLSNNSLAFNQSITSFNNLQLSAGNSITNNSSVNIGWVAGAGAEYIVAENWSIKGEYLFTQLGSLNVNGYPTVLNTSNNLTGTSALNGTIGPWSIHQARVGLNYHIGFLNSAPIVSSKY